MPARRALLLPLLFAFAAAALSGQDPPRLIVSAPPSLARAAAEVGEVDPARLAGAMRLVGLEGAGPPVRVLLAPEGSEAGRRVPSWVAGYAEGALSPIVLFPARAPGYPNRSLEALLLHELAHVLLDRAARGHPVPRWFNEGVAMAAARAWGFEDGTRLALGLLRAEPVPFSTVDAMFGAGQGEAGRAYALAGALVRDLLRQHGGDAAARILALVGGGVPFEEAFLRATGVPLAAAEAGFWERHARGGRWLPFLTSSFVLWLGVTLLALWAIKKRRDRDAALRETWEVEEAWLEEPGPDEPVN